MPNKINKPTLKKPAKQRQFAATAAPQTSPAGQSSDASSELDRIDRELLRLLQQDGRMTNADLADKVHLSAAACLERVRRLTRLSYILGYYARLDPVRLGCGMLVFVQVTLDRTTPDVFDRFKAAVQARSEIQECHMVAGGFDYLVKARVRDMRSYREFIAASIWSLPGIRETHTYTVMEEVKETWALPLKYG